MPAVPLHPYLGREPRIDPTAFVAPGARVIGDVTLGPGVSVWFNAVLRADSDAITVEARTNVQDGAVLHTDQGSPVRVGPDCTVGHLALVHGATVGAGSLVGMGAILLSGAEVGPESVVAAGALVPAGKRCPPRSLLVGSPARILRRITDLDLERLVHPGVRHYLAFAQDYRAALAP